MYIVSNHRREGLCIRVKKKHYILLYVECISFSVPFMPDFCSSVRQIIVVQIESSIIEKLLVSVYINISFVLLQNHTELVYKKQGDDIHIL